MASRKKTLGRKARRSKGVEAAPSIRELNSSLKAAHEASLAGHSGSAANRDTGNGTPVVIEAVSWGRPKPKVDSTTRKLRRARDRAQTDPVARALLEARRYSDVHARRVVAALLLGRQRQLAGVDIDIGVKRQFEPLARAAEEYLEGATAAELAEFAGVRLPVKKFYAIVLREVASIERLRKQGVPPIRMEAYASNVATLLHVEAAELGLGQMSFDKKARAAEKALVSAIVNDPKADRVAALVLRARGVSPKDAANWLRRL